MRERLCFESLFVHSFEKHGESYRDYAEWIAKNTAHDLIRNRTAIRENFYSGRLMKLRWFYIFFDIFRSYLTQLLKFCKIKICQ